MKIKDIANSIELYAWMIMKTRAHHLEMMASAFIKETKIPPRKVQLVEKQEGNKVIFYYEERNKND